MENDWSTKILQQKETRQAEFEKKYPKRNQLKIEPGQTYTLLLQSEGSPYEHEEFGKSIIFNVRDQVKNEDLVWFAKNPFLLEALAGLGKPFTGKTIRVTRTGKGKKDTKYGVELLAKGPDSSGYSKPMVDQEYM